MVKNIAIKFDRLLKNAELTFHKKYMFIFLSSEIGEGAIQYQLITNHFSNFVPLTTPSNYYSL